MWKTCVTETERWPQEVEAETVTALNPQMTPRKTASEKDEKFSRLSVKYVWLYKAPRKQDSMLNHNRFTKVDT